MKRTCQKLTAELFLLVSDLGGKFKRMPDTDTTDLSRAELTLRDAIANLRRVRDSLDPADTPRGMYLGGDVAARVDDDDAA